MFLFAPRLLTDPLEIVGGGRGETPSSPSSPRIVARACGTTAIALTALLSVAGCAPAGGDGAGSTGGNVGTGGGPTTTNSGGAGTLPGGTGGISFEPGTGGSSGSGGIEGGGGGASPDAGSGGASGGAAAPIGGGPATSGGRGGGASGGTGGRASGTGGNGAPLPPPTRDAASKQPVAKPPSGSKVESNFVYGPLATQRLDVLYPNDAGPNGTRTLPAVLMFHGGGWVHNFNDANGKDRMSTFADRFLAHGFIVFTAEYRVANSSPEAAPAPEAAKDALLAAKWCWDYLDYFHGDRARYVVTGASSGGHLALMVGMATPAAGLGPTSPADYKIAAIVDGYGPADIESELGGVAKGWFPSSLPNRAAIAKAVNPMTYVRMDIPPMIAVQGSQDNTAPVAHTRNLVAKLKDAGADVTMHEVPGAGHGFTTPASAWPDAEKAMFDWLTAQKIIGK